MKLRNLLIALKEQLPLKRAFRNFFITGNALGMLFKGSHFRLDGEPKISYSKKSALKASIEMEKKYGHHYSAYKCIYCDGYHIGKGRDKK